MACSASPALAWVARPGGAQTVGLSLPAVPGALDSAHGLASDQDAEHAGDLALTVQLAPGRHRD